MGSLYSKLHHKSFYLGLLLMALVPLLAIETPRIIAFVPVICVLFFWPNLTRDNFKPNKSDVIMLGFVAALFVFMAGHTLLFSVSPDASERLIKSVPLILGGVLFLYLIRRTPEFNHERFYRIVMLLCGVGAVAVIIEITQNAPLYHVLRGIEEDQVIHGAVFNRAAVALVTVFLATFFLMPQKKSIYVAACFIPMIMLLFVIESQSAQLGFICALLFYFLFPFKFKVFWLLLYTAICVYILSFPFIMPSIYEATSAELFQNEFLKNSYAGVRVEIWDFIARKIQENPWAGFGLEFTRGYEGFDARQIYTQRTSILHPHNFVLQIWIELGLAGILFIKALIGLSLHYLYHHKSELVMRAGATMLITFLLLNSFSYGFWQSWWIGLMFVISGLILLVSHRADDIKST